SDVGMWARRGEVAAEINDDSSNGKSLPGIVLPANVTASTGPSEALSGADEVVLAVPSQSLRGNLEQWVELVDEGAGVISLAKGIETGRLVRGSGVGAGRDGLAEGR